MKTMYIISHIAIQLQRRIKETGENYSDRSLDAVSDRTPKKSEESTSNTLGILIVPRGVIVHAIGQKP